MIELKTDRLRIIPLNAENLKLLIDSQKEMELKLCLCETESYLDSELKQALEIRLSKLLDDEQNYIWYTNWLIVLKDTNCCVGGIMLKGLPNKNGEVVIGYYTIPRYQGNGYMTETIVNIKYWLLNQPDVMSIIADTEKDNIASHRVLEKTGAEMYKETEELYYWRIS
ncbi:GNAT family N-acetyltransferase [Peribacillus psychrosaccharolyticus]|uniref:GNAT family N-acetyltransferase n=2 Tax=Peribacillus psychrosaccharolyticus TaxID=1407 RepID=A0A974S135_PERPY|nr:GNAT family N-acetyltransferase [Peribacillus psychrosaccharolyticus]MEC2057416.1 GNAT family N-acetyltransferase [Peribacillus psychrosaccharolyticus]MED3742758.1 GNAT family N-acetyltransferase [Peribacillus psychrosaccharolyticus]QQT01164.1 GNAT family N-acetyltransferase [Peribacillus psychrosaccharolyticus]